MSFSLVNNFSQILWKETLWLNFLRPLCALPVLITFSVLTNNPSGTPAFFISYPFLYLFIIFPVLLLIKAIASAAGGPLAWIIMVPLSLICITGGDPLVFLLSKVKPGLVPIKNYPFLSFNVAMFVLKPS